MQHSGNVGEVSMLKSRRLWCDPWHLMMIFTLVGVGCSETMPAPTRTRSQPVMPAAIGRVNVGSAMGAIISSTCSPSPNLAIKCPLYIDHQESFVRNGPEAAQEYSYTKDRGELVYLEKAAINPVRVRQGGQITLSATYTILSPRDQVNSLTIIREVKFSGKPALPASQIMLNKPNGTFGDRVTLTLPSPLLAGVYTVWTKILGEKAMDSQDHSFILE